MTRPILLRMILVLAVSIGLCTMPDGAFAQRGGRGGFGGFHGGGAGGFHGGNLGGFRGGSFGGFRGGSFGGFRGGFGSFRGPGFGGFRRPGFGGFRPGFGWRNGFWGYPRFGWGWGWGLNVGFGFGPYWGWGYPYYGWPGWDPYAYSAYSYPYYSYDDPNSYGDPNDRYSNCDYRYSDSCSDDRRAPDSDSRPNDQAPAAKPSNSTGHQASPERDYRVSNSEDYRVNLHTQSVPTNVGTVSYAFADLKTLQPSSQMRPAVRNVVQALKAMPPQARERQFSSGRFAGFSPAEKELLQNLVESHPAR